MKAIMVMFDSLNRHMLPPYGCTWVHAPNFARLAARSAVFERAYVGSMPCMPARRELHTGRYNFLHRSWGQLEPYDDSMPALLNEAGVYTHLCTDHFHYFEDGGATYHGRYRSWEFFRGQEGDPFIGQVTDPEIPAHLGQLWRQDVINRAHMTAERLQPQAQTVQAGLDFMHRNREADRWFLQVELFDPHEPFFTQPHYKALYPHDYSGPHFDWPKAGPVTEPPDAVAHLRYENAALVSMCDAQLGRILDAMDELGLWDDTLLIVNTDHGFLLGEHEQWAKCAVPFWQEVAHIPLCIWDPRCRAGGVRRQALVQTIDLPATLLEYFGVALPPGMQGVPLAETVATDAPVRDAALFGMHGVHVNVTDGRYVYMRAPVQPDRGPLFNYTLDTTRMRGFLPLEQLARAEWAPPFSFTKGCRLMKVPEAVPPVPHLQFERGHMLFDIAADPAQRYPLDAPGVEAQMIGHLEALMRANDAPSEQWDRLGL